MSPAAIPALLLRSVGRWGEEGMEQAEQGRPCCDENALGKEQLNLSALERCGSRCYSCSATCCWFPASSRLFQTPGESSQHQEGCLHQAFHREFTGCCGDGEPEACLALIARV